jgi:AcrR family transcriptional regulator
MSSSDAGFKIKRNPRARPRIAESKPLQDRAVQTQQDLLEAARRVFARDGFETAALEDIARAAGKTRGAFYAHFQNKEDLFFALIEQDIARDSEAYHRLLGPRSTVERRVTVMTGQMEALLADRSRMMLYLEFKMYAIRHPHRQKRLAALHRDLCRQGTSRKLKMIPELQDATSAQRRHCWALLGAVLDGLALSLYFDPGGLGRAEIRRKLEQAVRERLQQLRWQNGNREGL